MFLTEPQKKALILLNDNGGAYAANVTIKSQCYDGKAWASEYREYDQLTWIIHGTSQITYKPGCAAGFSDMFWSAPKTLSWSVAGELQNKQLAEVHIDIRNRRLDFKLTPLGQLEAGKLSAAVVK